MSDAEAETVRERVVAILAGEAMLDPAEVQPDASLDDLGIDSLGMIEAVLAIEDAFDIRVPFNANDPARSEVDIGSVDSIVRAVEDLIAAQRAGGG